MAIVRVGRASDTREIADAGRRDETLAAKVWIPLVDLRIDYLENKTRMVRVHPCDKTPARGIGKPVAVATPVIYSSGQDYMFKRWPEQRGYV
jgi:hypothetical protein